MSAMHTQILRESMLTAFEEDPSWYPIVARAFRRLAARTYPLQSVFFQHDRDDVSIDDAYGFCLAWSELCSGELAVCRIEIGATPRPDVSPENQTTLDRIGAPFSATVGGYEDDGAFAWAAPIVFDVCCPNGPTTELVSSFGSLPLEIGSTTMSRTLLHLRADGGIARWPYGSTEIVLLKKRTIHPRPW
jgi:hypothetical protein